MSYVVTVYRCGGPPDRGGACDDHVAGVSDAVDAAAQ
jgi:hypothetical protein